jgi:hypothetical protein
VHTTFTIGASIIALLPWTPFATALAQPPIPAYAAYHLDDLACRPDQASATAQEMLGGHVWNFVAPKAIDTSESYRRRFGTGLHVKPMDVLMDEARQLGAVKAVSDPTSTQAEPEMRLRLVLVLHDSVGQESGRVDRFVRVAVRVCAKRQGEWESVVYDTARAISAHEFWRARSEAAHEQDFAQAFRLAMRAALVWAAANADGNWKAGSWVEDPVPWSGAEKR